MARKNWFDELEAKLFSGSEESELEIVESQESTTTSKGVLRQAMKGLGYDIQVSRPKGGPPAIKIFSDVPMSVSINGEVVWTPKRPESK